MARYIIVFINRYIMILFLKMLMGHYITEGTAVSEIVVFPSKSKLTHLPSDCSFYLFCKKSGRERLPKHVFLHERCCS